MSPDAEPVLRVAVMLDQPLLPEWLAGALSEAIELGLVEVVAWILPAGGPPPPRRDGRLATYWRRRNVLGYVLAERLDRWRVGLPRDADPATDRVPVAVVAPEAQRRHVAVNRKAFSDWIDAEGIADIRALELDLIVRAGFRILRGDILSAARHGIWSFHHGDNRRYRGGPAGVWEVLDDCPTTGVVLQQVSEDLDAGWVLARSVGRTERFSMARNRQALYPRSHRMLVRSLARLVRTGSALQVSGEDADAWNGYDRRIYRIPTNREVARLVPRLLGRQAGEHFNRLRGGRQWSLGWHFAHGSAHDVPHGSLHRFREVPTPLDRDWADPFPVADERGNLWVFFEEFIHATGRGRICAWRWSPTGPVGEPFTVLDAPCHVSYPQVFAYEGQWYMLPECEQSGQVQLYRAERFPDRWCQAQVLLPGTRAVDSTLLPWRGDWYLFTSIAEPGIEYGEELHLFVGPGPQGPFRQHPLSPVVTDIACARMAGGFFRSGERLYRPAQIGIPRYGSGLAIREVIELTPHTYREAPVADLLPSWSGDLLGCHTINSASGLTVIDLLRRRRGVARRN